MGVRRRKEWNRVRGKKERRRTERGCGGKERHERVRGERKRVGEENRGSGKKKG